MIVVNLIRTFLFNSRAFQFVADYLAYAANGSGKFTAVQEVIRDEVEQLEEMKEVLEATER